MRPERFDLDLGDSHWLAWATDDTGRRGGALIFHIRPQDGRLCLSEIAYLPAAGRPFWDFSGDFRCPSFFPAVFCSVCADAGIIVSGRWEAYD